MTEIKVETRPPIPAIMHLRSKYGKHYGCLRREAMPLFRRPTMGDRMDNAAQKKWWNSKSEDDKILTMADTAAYEQSVRRAKHRVEGTKPYRGSKTETEHRRGGFWGK